MNDLHFAEPDFVQAFWIVAGLIGLLFFLENRGGRLLGEFVSPSMQSQTINQIPSARKRVGRVALAVALCSIVLALMRPQWGFESIQSQASGAEIIIALDVSRSMMAEDVVPNRLERAKAEIRDLLPYLEGDQVGLIAFAGRASVLCPLTPDFSFLRLVLDQVGPESIGRGGTRLEEPIREAAAGFGDHGDLARVILLITDGEDLDSFPVDAAQEAAERGVSILAIGFGDEVGSEIMITDPISGARQTLLDAEGRPVISRLDGAQLREIAMVGHGAYIPAGTGLLDLESIFKAHIQPLMRAEGGQTSRTVKQEGFQWALGLAWISLMIAVALGSGTKASILMLILVASSSLTPQEVVAQTRLDSPPRLTPPEVEATDPALKQGRPTDPLTASAKPPREALNAGLSALEGEQIGEAQSLFEKARQNAVGDGEVRYRATYNLGWLEVARADSLLDQEPAEALSALQRSADWFQEAVNLRPQAEAPRRNLEIVLARILILSDQLAEQGSKSLEQRLTALIDGQRSINQSLREVSETLQFIEDPHQPEAWRPVFRRLAVEERQWLNEARGLGESAATEQLNLEKKLGDSPAPEDAMRRFQLEGAQHQLHRARERMGQTRQQLRRRSAKRAHRRGALALERLKRSRAQLQDPVLTLEELLRDGARVHEDTQRLLFHPTPLLEDSEAKAPNPPPWLTADYLMDGQTSITERSAELDGRFAAASDLSVSPSDPEESAQQAQIQATAPFINQGRQAFESAQAALALEDLSEAERNQSAGLAALTKAREQLLDLRGLIELTYRDETRLAQALDEKTNALPGIDPGGLHSARIKEAGPAFVALQTRNLERAQRLGALIEQARSRAENASQNTSAAPDTASLKAESERLDTADGLLAMTESSMRGALKALQQTGDGTIAAERSRRSIASAVKGLEGLRRLFFSIVEHVRETLLQQQGLSDATNGAGGRDDSEKDLIIGPVTQRQEALGNKTEALAETLHGQALEASMSPESPASPETHADPESAKKASQQFSQAAEHVLEAAGQMSAAAAALAQNGGTLETARNHQIRSEEALQEALALLTPPPPPSDESTEPEASDSPEESESQTEQAATPQAETSTPGDDREPGQILQAVREREAERHRRRRPPSGYEPVDRDW
ncbi:MAG: hypothetical protein CBC48_13635 [bacterium TMED88]|nr:hypothetical protein [Deltaproteobacteria bacterium]OUV28030.1 MAG: hypothetical protein CBC48_13635 [bacterium TMED88]